MQAEKESKEKEALVDEPVGLRKVAIVGRTRGHYNDLVSLRVINRGDPGGACRQQHISTCLRVLLLPPCVLEDVEATEIQFLKTAVTRSAPLGFFEANIRANAERI
jgi:hypothetical protein